VNTDDMNDPISESGEGRDGPNSPDVADESRYDEAENRQAGVSYRLEGWTSRWARRRAARALRALDRLLVRLAKQLALTLEWKQYVGGTLKHQDELAAQPTSQPLHLARKAGVIIAELGFTLAALHLAGIQSPSLRFSLAVALAGLLVLAGQTFARTVKTAHLAGREDEQDQNRGEGRSGVEPPSGWDWMFAGVAVASMLVFAAALTVLRSSYDRSLARAQADAALSTGTQLTVVPATHTVPAWVLGVLALVAPLIAIFAEYAQYHPHAHRLRRGLRLYAWNTRKLRYVLRRCRRPVHRGRRALLTFDNLQSRALRMRQVIRAAHGGPETTGDAAVLNADEPVRRLRDRLEWYDTAAELAREALLAPHGEGGAADEEELHKLRAAVAQLTASNGKSGQKAVA
jgi:hypothetical protein